MPRLLYFLPLLALSTSASILSQIPVIPGLGELTSDVSARVLTHESHPEHSLIIKAHSSVQSLNKGDEATIVDICPGATSGYTGKPHLQTWSVLWTCGVRRVLNSENTRHYPLHIEKYITDLMKHRLPHFRSKAFLLCLLRVTVRPIFRPPRFMA